MNGKTLIICLGVLLQAPLSIVAAADDVTDLYFQQVIERYFEYPQNARTFGMAGSSVQTSTDSSSVMGNPAGLGFLQGGEVSGTYGHNRISGDEFPTNLGVEQQTDSGHAMLTLPIGPTMGGLPQYGNFGLAWAHDTSVWTNDSFGTESERTAVTAAYALAISETLTAGYSLGWVDDRFQSKAIFDYPMGDGFRHTLGATWKATPDTTWGTSAFIGHGQHHALFGPGIKGRSDTTQVGFDIGGQHRMDQWLFAASADYRHLSSDGEVVSSIPQNVVGGDEGGNIFGGHAGLEYTVDDMTKVRAGYRYAGLNRYKYNRVELNDLNGSANYNAWTLGLGLAFPIDSTYVKAIDLDYGVEYRAVGHDDWQHLVTASIPFNVCAPQN